MPKVLIIDDDPAVCAVLTTALEDGMGAEVQCVPTGTRGVSAIGSESFDLALIDGALPDMSGLQLALRAANENIPALIITGDPKIITKLGGHDVAYLAKPFGLDELIAVATRIIDEAAENIRRVKASAAQLRLTSEAFEAVVTESQRLVEQARNLAPRPASAPGSQADMIKVLIADDSKLARMATVSVLRTLQPTWVHVEAASAAEALATVARDKPDIALLDFHMPVRDGLSLAVELTALYPTMPVAIISANTQQEVIDRASALGATFIPKPLDGHGLGEFLYHAVRQLGEAT